MTKASATAAKLKALRNRAGLTLQEVAAALGKSVSSYQYYEDDFKRDELPGRMIADLTKLFVPRGIAQAEVLELTGVPSSLFGASKDYPMAALGPLHHDLDHEVRRRTELLVNVLTDGPNYSIALDIALNLAAALKQALESQSVPRRPEK